MENNILDKLYNDIVDQVKEAQLKLGYEYEAMRLYYMISSVNYLMDENYTDIKSAHRIINDMKKMDARFSDIEFEISNKRLVVLISPDTGRYIHENVNDNAFLKDLILYMKKHHHASFEDVCKIFRKYDENYVCERMEDNIDFDYVLHFQDEGIDNHYYCVKVENGHLIYHRFIKSDYEDLL